MIEDLIKLPTGELLNKFGSGSHKPGSGSAAALQGLLSVQLIRTVAKISLSKKSYSAYHKRIQEIKDEIENTIYPRLLVLLQEDSVQFDYAVMKRKERDAQSDPNEKSRLNTESQEALRITTEIPLEIGNLCLKLAEHAGFLFDHGFKSARGDSGVALNNALAAVVGCLSIIDLNLWCYKSSNDWTMNIRVEIEKLRDEYHLLQLESKIKMEDLKEEADRRDAFFKELNEIIVSANNEKKLSNSDIEKIAISFQETLLKFSGVIRPKIAPKDEMEVLSPEDALKVMGYYFYEHKTLGEHNSGGERWKVAGIIEQKDKIVKISEDFPPHTKRFTTAHELGHAILHKHRDVLHRDRPMDGSSTTIVKERTEIEANKFAACFLMPASHVKRVFKECFGTDLFKINEETSFFLNKPISDLREQCKDLRDLTRLLATVENYGTNNFDSLAKVFKVSPETMAIRLEEIGLVEY